MAHISRRNLILAVAAKALAQEGATFSTNVKVVSVLATVRDHDGRVQKGLTRDDFALLEDGVPQTIRYFSQESDLPLTVGLLVDTSRSQIGVLEAERRASSTFLNRVLRDDVLRDDKDRAFIAAFDEKVEVLQDLTASHRELEAALGRLRVPGRYATLIYSAIHDTSEDIMKPLQGRKAFILLTDGVEFRDPISIETAIEYAQRADCIIYTIRFSDHIKVYRPVQAAVQAAASAKGKQGLHRMANETGGTAYEVSKSETIEQIYAQIEDALRNQYNIGYTPDRSTSDGKYHKVKLTTKDGCAT
jgi:VWFA-related protein